MTKKGSSKVEDSPHRVLYEELRKRGCGMTRLKNKALELEENISTQTFYRYFKRLELLKEEKHPIIEEEKPKKIKKDIGIVVSGEETREEAKQLRMRAIFGD